MNKRGKIPKYLKEGYEPEYVKRGIEPTKYLNEPQRVASKQNAPPPKLRNTFREPNVQNAKIAAGQYDPREKRNTINIPNVGNVDKSWSSNRLKVDDDDIDLDAVQVGDEVQQVYNDEDDNPGDWPYDSDHDQDDQDEQYAEKNDGFRAIEPGERNDEYIIYHADNKYEASSKDEVLQLLDAMLMRDINIEDDVLVYKKINVKFGINLE